MSFHCNAEAVYTLRKDTGKWRGAMVADHVILQFPATFTLQPQHYVLFVHGYNNSYNEARLSYARFRWWLAKLNSRPLVLELHWPGDSPVFGLGWASYWRQIEIAKKCGQLLANWLLESPKGTKFVLTGHSLGCRLLLEALKRMDAIEQREKIAGICLMAAAVPVKDIKHQYLGPKQVNILWRILYSRGDIVLKSIFHMGQLSAFDSIFTCAVGYKGEPKDVWNTVGKCEEMHEMWNFRENYYNHGWYWQGGQKSSEPLQSDLEWVRTKQSLPPIKAQRQNDGGSARAIAELLGVPVERTYMGRVLSVERTLALKREIWNRPVGET